jgi:hypothetical protein
MRPYHHAVAPRILPPIGSRTRALGPFTLIDTGTAYLKFTASLSETYTTTDTGTAYLKLTPTLAEHAIYVDTGTAYLTFTTSVREHQTPFMFVFRTAPYNPWVSPHPHSPWQTFDKVTWRISRVRVGTPNL